jgi:hypothetical protein
MNSALRASPLRRTLQLFDHVFALFHAARASHRRQGESQLAHHHSHRFVFLLIGPGTICPIWRLTNLDR